MKQVEQTANSDGSMFTFLLTKHIVCFVSIYIKSCMMLIDGSGASDASRVTADGHVAGCT